MAARKTAAAKAPAAAETADAIDLDALYRVTLTRPVAGPSGDMLLPAHVCRVKGKHLAGLGEALVEAVIDNG